MQSKGLNERVKSLILIEKLLQKRNPLEYQAYIETFRESLIDANPHQIEAVIFALEKLENGGCILADEVGLGKTIEAGLVMAQYRACRRFNILIIVPTSLAGQWNNELLERFQIPCKIITPNDRRGLKEHEVPRLIQEDGVYIMGREFASRLEKERILRKKHWNLIVVDEAHEIFANIYQRFNQKDGKYSERSRKSITAANLYRLFKQTPLLMLTATPLQNNILEIWGLSSYILPELDKNYLGQYNHFRELFIQNGAITSKKIPVLKARLSNFLIRNLRKDAQIFMKYKFTDRNCKIFRFRMDDEEKALYNDISQYLERDNIYAYSVNGLIDLGNERVAGLRNLLKMNYRRVLGSSFSALEDSLNGIVKRLKQMKIGKTVDLQSAAITDEAGNDEEDRLMTGVETYSEEMDYKKDKTELSDHDIKNIEYEIQEVEGFIKRAERILKTKKDDVLIKGLKKIFSDPDDRFYQKAVIFTTFLPTQRHLKQLLEQNGFKDEIVLFSGASARSNEEKETIKEAIAVWKKEVGATLSEPQKPIGNILARTALVHYFKNHKKIFISTEAGAKGLNLQFCNLVINYDLPWNPQKIEQRIGRCHRYGQEKDVLVINCINADNEAEVRIYNILNEKFNVFRNVLGAGDDILGTSSEAIHFEKIVNDILNRCKTIKERLKQLKLFEKSLDKKTRQLKNERLKRARRLLYRLDPYVREKLTDINNKLPDSFSRYDEDMIHLLENYARTEGLPFKKVKQNKEQIFFKLDNKDYYIGKRDDDKIRNCQHVSLKHPLLEKIIKEIRALGDGLEACVYLDYSSSNGDKVLEPYVGWYGRWDFYNVGFSGVEEEEHLFDVIAVKSTEGIKLLNDVEIEKLKILAIISDPAVSPTIADSQIKDYVDEQVKEKYRIIQDTQQPRLDKRLENMEVELRDKKEHLENREKQIQLKLNEVNRKYENTTEREVGKQLVKERENLKKELKDVRKELYDFQISFQDDYDKEESKLLEKRFLDTDYRKVFTLHFQIRQT